VQTRDLTQRFGAMVALDRLNLEIPEGAIFGFIGPNGAGKTTTMRILTTLQRPTSGEAWVGGISVTADPRGVRRMVGFMPDFFGVYDHMQSWEYLDFFGRAYGVPPARRAELIERLLELVDLSVKRDSPVMSLSRGMKQRLSLARTMIHDPLLLILDEPASGLDPRARIELRELLKELRSMGKTVMISSHILTELAEMCTHIAIIERGRLLASGDVASILRSLQPHQTLELRLLGDPGPAEELLREAPGVLAVRRETPSGPEGGPVAGSAPLGQTLLVDFSGDEAESAALLARLIQADIRVTRFSERTNDLEDVFMRVTQGLVQ
jgi:ABC-2 type transport system ATP-binding protein